MAEISFSSGNIIDQLCNNVNQLNYTVCQLCKQLSSLQMAPPPVSTPLVISSFTLPAVAELFERYTESNTPPADQPLPHTWVTRTLNTLEEQSASTGIQLQNNIVILPIGIHELFIRSPATNVGEHQIQLYNLTTQQAEAYGSSAQAYNTTTDSWIFYTLALTSSASYTIRHMTSQVGGSLGVPGNHGTPEIYTQVRIRTFLPSN